MDGRDRFSLLLLEGGEMYFEDYAVIYLIPKDTLADKETWEDYFEEGIIRGRLKVCSKSLVFDPRDLRAPIIKFPFKEVKVIDESVSSHTNDIMFNGEEVVKVVEVTSSLTVEMLEKGHLQPYRYNRNTRTHQFKFVYVELSTVLPIVCQLHRASTLPPNDQNTMIQAIVRSKQRRSKFDRALLSDLREREVFEGIASKVTPLVTNPGTLLITDKTLYFHSHNNAEKHRVIKIKLSEIREVIKRRYLLRQVGLELFCREHCMVKHILLVFKRCEERESVYEVLLSQCGESLEHTQQDNMTYQWQTGAVSNYEYLLYLNSEADRSENDLTQYPVFPWVISDYTSADLDLSDPAVYRDLTKPVGALNKERLQRLKDRCRDMPEPRFLYGSHYSTPGFVLYYLVRQHPLYMLCLQNGRFDHPDRMFNSLQETWHNVTTNPSDFKELIPQFYNLDSTPDFLTNTLRIDFGTRQNGKPVGDVDLPPWANGDPMKVVRVLREALESDVVSNSLHHWIDLVFGYKQRGEEAERADNVFYHLCYEGSVDLGAITDLNDRLAIEVQITEFGQIPKQLFTRPHPPRSHTCLPLPLPLSLPSQAAGEAGEGGEGVSESSPTREGGGGGSGGGSGGGGGGDGDGGSGTVRSKIIWGNAARLNCVEETKVHKDTVMGVGFTSDNERILSVERGALAKLLSVPQLEQVRSIRVGSMPVSCCQHVPDTKTVLVGSWDNNVYRYSLEYGQVGLLLQAHSDAVSCLHWQNDILVTGSLDCTARLWSLVITPGQESSMSSVSASQNILAEMDHESPVLCLALDPTGTLLATGTQEGQVVVWKVPKGECLNVFEYHNGAVWGVSWCSLGVDGGGGDGDGGRVISGGQDGRLIITEVNDGKKVCANQIQKEIRCLCWDGVRVVVCGTASGDLIVYDMGSDKVLKDWNAHQGAVTSLGMSYDLQYLATGGEDRKVKLWSVTLD